MASVAGYEPSVARSGEARTGRDSSPAAPRYKEIAPPQSLARLIESEVIPRLMFAHGAGPGNNDPQGSGAITLAEIEAFVPLSLEVEAGTLFDHVDRFMKRGVTIDTLLVDLLAPTARRLGELWEDDRCDFVDVTMGLWRLQQLVHDLVARVPAGRHGDGRSALFAAMPGDQHGFGTIIVDEIFRMEGWRTDLLLDPAERDLLDRVSGNWFDLVGLTVSRTCHIERLPSIIRDLRSVSANARMCVMVGGSVFAGDPVLALRVGADGTAPDAKQAVKIAGSLVGTLVRETAYG